MNLFGTLFCQVHITHLKADLMHTAVINFKSICNHVNGIFQIQYQTVNKQNSVSIVCEINGYLFWDLYLYLYFGINVIFCFPCGTTANLKMSLQELS